MAAELVIVLVLILVNGFFSGAEIAVISLRRSRLEQLRDSGSRRARLVTRLRDQPERFLATVQIGITLAGATAAAFGGAAIAQHLAPALERTGLSRLQAWEAALAIVVVSVSFLSLVLGELVPKSLALKFGERYALAVAGPLVFLSAVVRPFVWLLTATSNLLLRPFGDRTNFTETRLSPEELRQIVRDASRAGTVDVASGEIAARAIEFDALTARDLMVPRDRIVALPRNARPEEIPRLVREAGHSRLPVYEGDLDHVAGYIAADELLASVVDGGTPDVGRLLRSVPFVPEGRSATSVLQQLQRERRRLAMVVDEFGGIAGLVTLEDLVEELVGEVTDERGVPDPVAVRRAPDGSALVRGETPLHALERELGAALPEGHYSTVAGLVLEIAGRIPSRGERFTLDDGTRFEIVDATQQRIRMVRVQPAAEGDA